MKFGAVVLELCVRTNPGYLAVKKDNIERKSTIYMRGVLYDVLGSV